MSSNERIVEGSISITRSAMFNKISGPKVLLMRPVGLLPWAIDSILGEMIDPSKEKKKLDFQTTVNL